ncbi:MAG: TonB-dependent receptor [Gammaproteobacteria bacterium]|nr:TonB-dependent receptor [Gammaproteobacteria bacterium]NNF48943.1 TonB-dependent receptor [Woeseiaceae bacterium]MBT8093253.1 TonB-dependent receptor [Gammaproteobacteria bacterium]MBT8106059.1 TonB-dependent receptor [Gammaproteobacteria bacterium]NNK26073.1 TonB-dependent receptor [Woeseiaceae bacterium]
MSSQTEDRRFRVGAAAMAAASTALISLFATSPSMAQEGAAGVFLEEIVTTARKRSTAETVQDVPVAVSAFGAQQIEAMFVKKIDDLSYLMPNVQLESVGTFPGVQNFSIRGQGINSSIPSVDPTVGVFVDGLYMGTTYGVVIDTFDLESVEVLRGPQGLLFGRNVTGGAVVLRNARPSGEFGLRLRAGGTDENQNSLAFAVEGALMEDVLAGKLAVLFDDDRGYYQSINTTAPSPLQPFYINPAAGGRVGAMETLLVRPSLVFTPGDNSEWTLMVERGQMDGDGAAWSNVTAQRAGAVPEFETLSDETGFTSLDWTQIMFEVSIAEVGNGTLTNIFGIREVEADSAADIDGTDLPIFAAPGYTEQDQISNELRWSGSLRENWDATIGLYYFEQDIEYREARYIWLPPPLGPAPFGINLQAALGGDMFSKNLGIFWTNDFHISDRLTLTAGLRYTDEEKTASIIDSTPDDPGTPEIEGPGVCTDNETFDCSFVDVKDDWQNITPRLGAMYHLSDDTRIYGYWSKGFRSGGVNFRNAKPQFIPPGPTREEESNTIEIGLKTEFNDGKMRLNVAAYHNDIKDMQRELNIGDQQVIVLQATINAGDVTITGVEADFAALLTDNFSITASFGWQDGEYDSLDPFVPALESALRAAGAIDPDEVVIGDELPRLAPTNYSLGFLWDIPVGEGLVNVAANHSFREGHPYNDSNTELFDDQERTNASVNWFPGDDRWMVSLYGKNLTDEANWGNLTSIAGLWTAGPMKKGRIIGFEVNYSYE